MMEEEVKHHKGGSSGSGRGLVQLLFVVSVVLCLVLYAPPAFVRTPYSYYRSSTTDFIAGVVDHPPPVPSGDGGEGEVDVDLDNEVGSPCSRMRNNSICCDRRDFNTDVCFMAGDVRTDAASLSLLLMSQSHADAAGEDEEKEEQQEEERIRPYTRKWERHIMARVQEMRLIHQEEEEEEQSKHDHTSRCDVRHDAPLLVMTAGGYTGNLFHAFSDGFVPAWVTSQHLRRRVVLGVLSYNPWWAGTFSHIIAGLSAHDVVDLLHDKRTHCFPGAIVGTRFHGILAVDPKRLKDNKSIVDFNSFLAKSYHHPHPPQDKDVDHHHPRDKDVDHPHHHPHHHPNNKEDKEKRRRPRLGIVSRKGTRVIENEKAVAQLAESVGFHVEILETANGLPLSATYATVSACDALVGVHGADLTKFLFLPPGASFTQIAPLGYEVRGHESSLVRKYPINDDVIADPEKAKRNKGWNFVAQVYLGGQNVSLDLGRFRQTLKRMHARALLLPPSSSSSEQHH
ncbi:hypothetical protein PR202_gb03709 [Eleusine coracana subsp. coracana]|uniref:Glycosyltransferase 61 catalytic domain-containing protein n=1 Tax=Eleusine coracana subsp. coracana TaxID=191504 RepID=A0AAV5E3J7_ELECO|nr:hypothetical protein PR202_gb03709 [Eleusine coracana subsp. coracana]